MSDLNPLPTTRAEAVYFGFCYACLAFIGYVAAGGPLP